MPLTTFAPVSEPAPDRAADLRSSLDREIAAAVKPLGEVLSLSREASGAMRAELERLEARFNQIKAEAGQLAAPRAAPAGAPAVATDRLQEVCEQAGAAEQRLAEAVGEAGGRLEELELRGGRVMRACDEVAARQDELARAGEQRRAEMERISEMPLARIEAAADAAAARLESLIEHASEAAARFERAAREHVTTEVSLHEAAERLSPWQGVLDGSAPGPVEDLASAMRLELRQEMTSLGAGLAQLAEAVVALAQARAEPAAGARRKRQPAGSPRAPARRKAAQQVEAKPGRASPSGRAATRMKSVARDGRKKASRRATGAARARKPGRAAHPKKGRGASRAAAPAPRRGKSRKAAGARR